MPATYVTILTFELINGVGATPGTEVLACLRKLEQRCFEQDALGIGPSVTMDLRRWERDYAICMGLDVQQTVAEADRAFGAVASRRCGNGAGRAFIAWASRTIRQRRCPPTDDEVSGGHGQRLYHGHLSLTLCPRAS